MHEKPNLACPNSCLCEHCARTLTCVDCIYFPWSIGKGCSQGGTSACRYFERERGRTNDERGTGSS